MIPSHHKKNCHIQDAVIYTVFTYKGDEMKNWIFCSLMGAILLINKPLTAQTECCNRYWVDIDYLYWNATQSNMTYAIIVDDPGTLGSIETLNQKTNWSSGFRLGAGTCLPCCGETHFSWTRFHNSAKGSNHQSFLVANQILAPDIGVIVGGDGEGGPAASRWNLNFDMFDWDFGFTLYDSCACSIHPILGVKGLRLNQRQLITYDNFRDTNNNERVNASVTQTNNSWGIGPKAGFESIIKLGCKFRLVGSFAASTLYGGRHTSATTSITETGVTTTHDFRDRRNRLSPQLEFFLGIDWSTCLCECYPLDLRVGYETQYFWNTWRVQNSVIQNFFVTHAGFGDLMLHGLTARLTVGF